MFVTNFNSFSVGVISDTTNTVVATISVGDRPYGIAYDPAKGEVFVANKFSDSVSVISDATNTVVANVPVPGFPSNPEGVAYDPA
ncbi:MAG: YncE family protein, partial [Methanobacteriota archaeon]